MDQRIGRACSLRVCNSYSHYGWLTDGSKNWSCSASANFAKVEVGKGTILPVPGQTSQKLKLRIDLRCDGLQICMVIAGASVSPWCDCKICSAFIQYVFLRFA